MIRRSPSRLLATALVAALPLLAASAAAGQLTVSPNIDPAALGLSAEPIVSETVGVAFYPPERSLFTTETVNGLTSLVLMDADEPPRWRLRLQGMNSSLEEPNAANVVDDHLAKLTESGRRFRVLENSPVRHGGVPGRLLLIEEPGPAGQEVVNGWLVLPRGGRDFVVMTILTSNADLGRIRPQLDASFSTISLASPTSLAEMRRTRVTSGDDILATFTPERLRSMTGRPQSWYRIYQPGVAGGTPDRELGYFTLEVLEARRGELEPSRDASRYRGVELDEGLMVVLQARAIINDDPTHILDVNGRYWMDWDRSSEAWSHRSLEQHGKVKRGFKQTGIRNAPSTGEPRPVLTVVNDSSTGELDSAPQRWAVPEHGYLAQPEVFLLGGLLPRDKGDLELSFYYFDTKGNRMPQRVDRWTRAADGSGTWVLSSKPALDEPSVTQIFNASGQRLRRVDVDGTVTERIEPQALLSLWRSKGLPTS